MIKRIWMFTTPPTATGLDLMLRRAEYLRLTDMAVFVNGLDEREFVIPAARERRLSAVVMGLHRLGVSPHLVSWLRPTERYMRAAADKLRPLCMTLGANSLMFDAEEPWTRHPSLHGRGETAAEAFLARHWSFDYWPCELGVSGITYIPSAVRPLARRCQYVLPQAYSVAHVNASYRPGVTQRLAHERWQEFGKPIVMGLAAWKLNRHGGLSQTGSMQRAITAAEDLGVDEVAYWSLRWVVESAERTEFVRQAATKARAGRAQRDAAAAPERERALALP
jgi:hypothetical protein